MAGDYLHGSKDWPWFVLTLTADVLSILGSVWLSIRLLLLSPKVRRRLFPRQLRSLALADVIFHLSALPIIIVDYMPNLAVTPAVATTLCSNSYAVFHVARLICVFNEMHLALSFLVQSFRRFASPPALHWTIPLTWVAGLVLGIIARITNPWFYDSVSGLCQPQNFHPVGGGDIISVVAIVVCFVVSSAAYIAVRLRSYCWSSPGSVQNNNFRRAAFYPLNFLLTYGFMMVVYCNSGMITNRIYFSLAAAFEFLNGFLNTATYALQSRYAATLWNRLQTCELRARSGGGQSLSTLSFHVDIGGVDIVEVLASFNSDPGNLIAGAADTSMQ